MVTAEADSNKAGPAAGTDGTRCYQPLLCAGRQSQVGSTLRRSGINQPVELGRLRGINRDIGLVDAR